MFAGGPKSYSYDPKEKTRQVSHECALEHYDRTRLLWFVDYLYLHYVVKTVRSGYHVIVERKCHFGLVYYSAPDNGAKYCDDCVCLSVSISLELQFTSSPILVLVTCGRGSVLLCCYCDTYVMYFRVCLLSVTEQFSVTLCTCPYQYEYHAYLLCCV